MERQMRATDANAVNSLAHSGPTPHTDVQRRLYVLDVDAAFAAPGDVRREAYGTPRCVSNLVGLASLAFLEPLIEITLKAMLPGASSVVAVTNFHCTDVEKASASGSTLAAMHKPKLIGAQISGDAPQQYIKCGSALKVR